MNLESMTIKEAKELIQLFGGKKVSEKKRIDDGGVRICILQRGWVVVGKYSQIGSECKLTDANVIRTWGTTKGLGEIASNGPTTSTKLDPCPDVYFHELVGVFQMKCEDSKWLGKLR